MNKYDAAPDLGDAILETASDAIVASDSAGVITFWNPGAVRIFGHTSEEATGQSLDLIIPENLRDRHWQGYRTVMQSGLWPGRCSCGACCSKRWRTHLGGVHHCNAARWGRSSRRDGGHPPRRLEAFRGDAGLATPACRSDGRANLTSVLWRAIAWY